MACFSKAAPLPARCPRSRRGGPCRGRGLRAAPRRGSAPREWRAAAVAAGQNLHVQHPREISVSFSLVLAVTTSQRRARKRVPRARRRGGHRVRAMSASLSGERYGAVAVSTGGEGTSGKETNVATGEKNEHVERGDGWPSWALAPWGGPGGGAGVATTRSLRGTREGVLLSIWGMEAAKAFVVAAVVSTLASGLFHADADGQRATRTDASTPWRELCGANGNPANPVPNQRRCAHSPTQIVAVQLVLVLGSLGAFPFAARLADAKRPYGGEYFLICHNPPTDCPYKTDTFFCISRVSRRPVRRRDGRAGCDVRVRDRGGHESHTRACAGARTSGRVRQFRGVGAGHRGIRGVRAGENGGRVWVEGRERERFWNRGAGFNSARQRHGRYTGRVHRVRVSVGAGVGVRFGVGGGSCGDERGTSGQRRGRRGRRDDGDDDEARRGERGVERGHEHERRGQKTTTSGGIGIGTQLAKTNSSRRLARAFR